MSSFPSRQLADQPIVSGLEGSVFTVHGTKKLLDRVKPVIGEPVTEPDTVLGNWYATALMWRPQAALFVNELTRLPVFVPLAPAKGVGRRIGSQVGRVLEAIGTDLDAAIREAAAMEHVTWAKTASRSVIGSMNEFAYLAEAHLAHERTDLFDLSVRLAATPCGPLYATYTFPDKAAHAAFDAAYR
jgi:hypothetical protein